MGLVDRKLRSNLEEKLHREIENALRSVGTLLRKMKYSNYENKTSIVFFSVKSEIHLLHHCVFINHRLR